jgi:hypothetical protein
LVSSVRHEDGVQYEPYHQPPVWRPVEGAQRMTIHLDIAVEDLAAGGRLGDRVPRRVAYPAGSARYWYFATGRTSTKPRSPRRSGFREAL